LDEVRSSPLVVTVVAGPRARSAWIRLVGNVDMHGEPALAYAVECLRPSGPDAVVVDLTAVTFVCSTFVNFVADVHAAVPDASLILHSPSPMTRRLLAVTGLDTLVTMPDDIESTHEYEPGGADRGGR
jgi:anti-anti-sigma factor